jgi:chaperone modulatory protein CbpM
MKNELITGVLLDEQVELSLSDLCRACSRHAEWVIELVTEGVLDPVGNNQVQWRFSGLSLQKAHTAMRLERDLGLNIAGVALALDLMDEVEVLRGRLCRLEAKE